MFTHAIVFGRIGNADDPIAEGWEDRVGDNLRKMVPLRDGLAPTIVRWRKLGRTITKIHLTNY